MRDPGPSPIGESSEEGRALLQIRVALFWKVMFFISLLSVGLGAVGAIVKPGLEIVVGLAQLAQTGAIWWICSRGQRSAQFYRVMETAGLLVNVTASALLGRHVVTEFVRDHAFVTPEGALMSDAYITLLHVAGIGLLLAVRAALVPSSPRRTISVTAIVGAPLIASIFWVQTAEGGFAWRALDSDAYPWMPGNRRDDVGLRDHHLHRDLLGHLRPSGRGPGGAPARPIRARTQDRRRRDGGGLPRPPRHDAAPLSAQADEE